MKRGRKNRAWKTHVTFKYNGRGRSYAQPLAFRTRQPPRLRLAGHKVMVRIRIHKLNVSYEYELGNEKDRLDKRAKAIEHYAQRQRMAKGVEKKPVAKPKPPSTPKPKQEPRQPYAPTQGVETPGPGDYQSTVGTPAVSSPTTTTGIPKRARLQRFKAYTEAIRGQVPSPVDFGAAKHVNASIKQNQEKLGAHIGANLQAAKPVVAKAVQDIAEAFEAIQKPTRAGIDEDTKVMQQATGTILRSSNLIATIALANPGEFVRKDVRQRGIAEAVFDLERMMDESNILKDVLGTVGKSANVANAVQQRTKLLGPMLVHSLQEQRGVAIPRPVELPVLELKPTPEPVDLPTLLSQPAAGDLLPLPPVLSVPKPVKLPKSKKVPKSKKAKKPRGHSSTTLDWANARDLQGNEWLKAIEQMILALLSTTSPRDFAVAGKVSKRGVRAAGALHTGKVLRKVLKK